MAQFFTDFSDDSIGSQPANTTILEGTAGFTVESNVNASNGKALFLPFTDYEANTLRLDYLPAANEVEIYERVALGGNSRDWSIVIGDETTGVPQIRTRDDFGDAIVQRFDGAFTTFARVASTLYATVNDAAFFKRRFYYNQSTQEIKVKLWNDSDPEPSAWLIETTGSITSSTLKALITGYGYGNAYIDTIGIGTNGDPAPSLDGVSAPVTPINLGVENLTANSVRLTWEQG